MWRNGHNNNLCQMLELVWCVSASGSSLARGVGEGENAKRRWVP